MKMRTIEDISEFIFAQDPLAQADIIMIPGGSHPELGERAAEIWRQGYAPLVMPSGGVSVVTGRFGGVKSKQDVYNAAYETDCAFLTDVLLKNGVPKEAILEENTSGFTKENALFSRRVADSLHLNIRRAILCCKCFHARRALMSYQFAFPETEFIVQPVRYYEQGVEISRDNWYHTEAGIRRVLGEMQRCSSQFDDGFLRLREGKL